MIDGEHFAIEYHLLVTCSAVGPVTRRRKMFSYSHLTVHKPARDHDLHTQVTTWKIIATFIQGVQYSRLLALL